ncbi:MAG: hypothetical protein MUC91_12610, partial [Verrucomicrobia bacterium]|nr:hypothetical protein [Verrucomicrobiota bacterium]
MSQEATLRNGWMGRARRAARSALATKITSVEYRGQDAPMNEPQSALQETASSIVSTVSSWFRQVWNMELFSSSGNPVQLSQIVVAFAVLVVG